MEPDTDGQPDLSGKYPVIVIKQVSKAEREHKQKREYYPNCDKGGVLPPLKKGELVFM